jgi:hypothetical protein
MPKLVRKAAEDAPTARYYGRFSTDQHNVDATYKGRHYCMIVGTEHALKISFWHAGPDRRRSNVDHVLQIQTRRIGLQR